MITASNLRTRFPEFADKVDYPTQRLDFFIQDAVLLYMPEATRWGNKYDIALSYLSAHLLVMADKSSLGDSSVSHGPISTKTVDKVTVTRATTPKDQSDADLFLMSTAYGQRYKTIRDLCFVGVVAANCL